MKFTPYQKLCYKFFGPFTRDFAAKKYRLKRDIERARIDMLPEGYLAYTLGNTAIAVIVGVIVMLMFNTILAFVPLKMPVRILLTLRIFSYLLPIILGAITYILFLTMPSSRAKARRADIDAHLPYAANFIAAMGASNATPEVIFKSLGKQEDIYGEISKEATWLYRDTAVLGMDMITAIKKGVDRSPSEKFQDFLQGIIGTLASGGDIKTYFLNRAEYYMRENRRDQKDFIETLGIFGESYMVVAVAAPLLIIVMMVVMSWIGGGVPTDVIMPLIIFVMLPMIHMGYAVVIYLSSPKL